MGQIDVAKVITAAAASTLGVLSLIILAVAFTGFHFFKRSGDGVKVGVWAAMLLAAIGFGLAVVRQGGEQARAEKTPAAERSTPASNESPIPQAMDGSAAEPDESPMSAIPQRSASGASAPADISGRWRDEDGYLYDVMVRGTALAYQQSRGGVVTGYGQGTFIGRKLDYAFVSSQPAAQGSCSGTLSRDGQRIAGQCVSGGAPWDFAVER